MHGAVAHSPSRPQHLYQTTSDAYLQAETFPAAEEGGPPRLYMDMSFEERDKLLKTRLKKYCQKVPLP